jgi:hypothetical protein
MENQEADNSQKTVIKPDQVIDPGTPAPKKKRKATSGSWKTGHSGNYKGAPKRGQSWTEVMRWWADQTPAKIKLMIGTKNPLGQGFNDMPQGVIMKNLVTLRLLQSLMFEPTSGILKEFMDRAEGKVPDNINMGVQENMRPYIDTMMAVYGPYYAKHPNEIPKRRKSKRSKPSAGV